VIFRRLVSLLPLYICISDACSPPRGKGMADYTNSLCMEGVCESAVCFPTTVPPPPVYICRG
jgi:hypothetical protein